MHVEGLIGLAFDQAVDLAPEESEIDHALHQYPQGRFVISDERHAGSDGGDGCLLRCEHDFIDVALRCAEVPTDRIGAGDVGRVAGELAAGVDEDQRAFGEYFVVIDVMQHAGTRTAGDDGREGVTAGALTAELVDEFGFQRVFGQAGATGAHGARVAGRGDVGGAAQTVEFVRVLDKAQSVEQLARIADLCWRSLSRTRLGAYGAKRASDLPVPVRIVPERMPQDGSVGDQFRQTLFQFIDGVGFVDAEGFTRGRRPVAEAVPDFALDVLLAAEQQRARRLAADQHQRRLGFRESGEVPEIAVETVRVQGIAITHTFRRGWDEGDTVAELLQ